MLVHVDAAWDVLHSTCTPHFQTNSSTAVLSPETSGYCYGYNAKAQSMWRKSSTALRDALCIMQITVVITPLDLSSWLILVKGFLIPPPVFVQAFAAPVHTGGMQIPPLGIVLSLCFLPDLDVLKGGVCPSINPSSRGSYSALNCWDSVRNLAYSGKVVLLL